MVSATVLAFGAVGRLLATIGLTTGGVDAQQYPGLTQDQLQQLQNRQGTSIGQNVSPQESILEPNVPPNPLLPTSRLEQLCPPVRA